MRRSGIDLSEHGRRKLVYLLPSQRDTFRAVVAAQMGGAACFANSAACNALPELFVSVSSIGCLHLYRCPTLQISFDPVQPDVEDAQVAPIVPIDLLTKTTLDDPHRCGGQPRKRQTRVFELADRHRASSRTYTVAGGRQRRSIP